MSYAYGGQVGQYGPPPPPRKKSKVGIYLLVAVIALIAICGGVFAFVGLAVNEGSKEFTKITTSGGPTSQTVANVHKIGEVVPVKYNGGEAKFQITEIRQSGTYVNALVVVEGVSGQVPYNPLYFMWRNADGTEAHTSFPDTTPLQAGTVLQGAKAQGWINFENCKLDGGQLLQSNQFLTTVITWTP